MELYKNTMEDSNSIVYGLESQARAMAAQLAESQNIRYFIATQTLKRNANQLHLIEMNEDCTAVQNSKTFAHPAGEVWRLQCSPNDSRTLVSCYSRHYGSSQNQPKNPIVDGYVGYELPVVQMQTAILRLPAEDDTFTALAEQDCVRQVDVEVLDTERYGKEIRTTEFHPTDQRYLATVVDGTILLHERAESQTRVVAKMEAKNATRFGMGRWSLQHQGNQFVVLHETGVRSFDVRDANHVAWSMEMAHSQLIRDIDCNPNKQYHFATVGDDLRLKVWDSRNLKNPLLVRLDHSHWIWSVRFNTFHDQLILTSSSDCKVLLTCAASCSSEIAKGDDDTRNARLTDGLLEVFAHHEDSVYSAEWSSVDPWVFATLSYDGRVIIAKVPKQYKYKILL